MIKKSLYLFYIEKGIWEKNNESIKKIYMCDGNNKKKQTNSKYSISPLGWTILS